MERKKVERFQITERVNNSWSHQDEALYQMNRRPDGDTMRMLWALRKIRNRRKFRLNQGWEGHFEDVKWKPCPKK